MQLPFELFFLSLYIVWLLLPLCIEKSPRSNILHHGIILYTVLSTQRCCFCAWIAFEWKIPTHFTGNTTIMRNSLYRSTVVNLIRGVVVYSWAFKIIFHTISIWEVKFHLMQSTRFFSRWIFINSNFLKISHE